MGKWIDADVLKIPNEEMIAKMIIDSAPSIEPNRILPERMERGDIYEVGETIVVMNHDDYYDLLCKSWEPKRGEWNKPNYGQCSNCRGWAIETENGYYFSDFCPNCGADMREVRDE